MRNAVTACMIRHQSENNPRRKCQSTPALQPRLLFAVATSILRRKNAPFCAPASNPNFKCRVAAQTYSTSNITKYCTCHEKLTLMIDPRHRWKVLYLHCTEQYAPPSFNPTKSCACPEKNIREWPSSHLKRETHWHCAVQPETPSHTIKYCACHAKWPSWLILLTYGMSGTMHKATEVTIQHHQIRLHPPGRTTLMMIDPLWQCAEQRRLPSKRLQNPRDMRRNPLKRICTAGTIRPWSENKTISPHLPHNRGYL